jgi:Kef-type K+ transport system membrane component KefB
MENKAQIAPIIVSVIILVGFGGISLLAMKPGLIGDANQNVVLMLVGQWSTLSGLAAGYWLGSSASSKAKDNTIENMAAKQ